jgi:hypothetical protein
VAASACFGCEFELVEVQGRSQLSFILIYEAILFLADFGSETALFSAQILFNSTKVAFNFDSEVELKLDVSSNNQKCNTQKKMQYFRKKK